LLYIDNIEVFGLEPAFRGLRNPMNSWEKSDSIFNKNIIGDKDLDLAQRMIKAGTDESKFMRQIFVTMDITAPLYWWKQMDQYKVGTSTNSTSTMHKIQSKEFTISDFSYEHLMEPEKRLLQQVIDCLNMDRNLFNETKNKDFWWQLIQLLPSSYNQMRTWSGNYQNLRNIYFARKNHKLDEWRTFCEEIKKLPYAKELICYGE